MVHVSGARLRQDALNKINLLLYKVIRTTKNVDDFQQLFTEIFSKKEQILIAKRVVIMYLLIKDIPQREIARALKVSTATVTKYATFLKDRKTPLTKLMSYHLKQEAIENLLEDIFFNLFVQPGIKIGHWNSYWQHQKRKAKRNTSGI